jgi:hypothetical protein
MVFNSFTKHRLLFDGRESIGFEAKNVRSRVHFDRATVERGGHLSAIDEHAHLI